MAEAKTRLVKKKDFLKWLEANIKDDEIVVLSPNLEEVKVQSKRNVKKLTFGFAADAFKSQGVKHAINGDTPFYAFAIAPKEALTEETLSLIN